MARRTINRMRLPDLRGWLARIRPQRAAPDGVPWPDPGEGAEDADSAPAPPHSAWSPLRIEVAESLWGEGCLMPGGADEVLRLAVPLGLTAKSSLLLLGAGSGGPMLRLASELGVWVCGCESDPGLAAVAARRVQRAGVALAKRATVQVWNPAAPAFRRQAFHHAILVEALRAPRPEDVLAAVAQAVRPGGQIALLETVAPAPLNAADSAIAALARLERREPPPPGTDWVTRPLVRLGFEIRVAEDVSTRHIRLAVTGWKHLVRQMTETRPTPQRAAALVAEAELWLRRIELMRAGKLRLMRWLAIGGGAGPAGAARVVADAQA
jgi:SAM-dependent methyltransferase